MSRRSSTDERPSKRARTDTSHSRTLPATTDLPTYTYEALERRDVNNGRDEIRLVDILPGSIGTPLECEIITVGLAENPQYEALSYVWGTGGLSHEIRIRGTTTSKLLITATLYSALQRLRFEDCTRRIWIDQVCINLTDNLERGHQVRFMSHIYLNAKRVVIDLGEGTEDSDKAFDYAATPHDAARFEDDFVLRNLEPPVLQNTPIDIFHSIKDILLRPWFQRIWVIQEAVLASDILVYCGHRTVSWSQLFAMSNIANDPSRRVVMPQIPLKEYKILLSAWGMLRITTIARRRCNDILGVTLADAVVFYRDAQATDPRDKIFSLLGIATDDVAARIEVDYSKSVSLVYRDFARVALEEGDLFLLNYAGIAQASILELPSWVPGLCRRLIPMFNKQSYRASGLAGNRRLSVLTSADMDMIHLKCAVVDEVKTSGKASPENFDKNSILLYACECQEIIEGLHEYPTGEEVLEAYCRTLIGDYWGSYSQTEAPERYSELYMTLLPSIERGDLNVVQTVYLENVYLTSAGRRLCVTRDGYIGMVLMETREGDVICIIFGADRPFVLRKVEDAYCLIGECYIHGLMNGEALELEHFKEEMLPLR